ncbi:MAG: ATPase [Candidatus Melainabacteria bacterium HGW-Melainabacteria-1]|nr:MAG: ATPase [Candidatus Melainabacteria bacterium HGW-Melainabacteria-1]
MKYGDLIQFEPLETVIKLILTEAPEEAGRLISSFVISDEMADRLSDLVFPQLQFAKPADNRGLLIIGNYGTGKSHLMAVLSALAEYPELLPLIRHADVRKRAEAISGKFKVIRTEIGASEMTLRDIIVSELESHLAGMGVQYHFPQADQLVNHQHAFEEMMMAFHKVFPDQGLLLVVDELLDYLRVSPDLELIRALNFLREVGEACKSLRFRFMAGIQESLFESPRFQFAADSLKRVKDRFEQMVIARSDIHFVVKERLLAKTGDQRVKIQKHLQRFTPWYASMNEKLEDYVSLFPIHPDYIGTFSDLTLLDKRHILRTLSEGMRKMLSRSIPEQEPGLEAFDSFWSQLSEEFRSLPEVREVSQAVEVLKDYIQNRFTRPQYRPMALRIIDALAVHRLATGDIHAPIGLTCEEMRDRLCLYDPTLAEMKVGEPAVFLLKQIQVVLREIIKTVSGQFISHNPENNQYFLDLKRTVDYAQKISERCESLDEPTLNRAFYQVLQTAMECSDNTVVATGFKIWQHELEWLSHKASRLGYLFFGAPNERSTAQPPRDFYLYFLQPFNPPSYRNEKKSDEVFFVLSRPDEKFEPLLRNYAAALDLREKASGPARQVYESKAREFSSDLTTWIYRNLQTSFEVISRGKTRQLPELVRGRLQARSDEPVNVRDLVNTAASVCLEDHFLTQSPEYPAFSLLITNANRPQAARDALRSIAGENRTRQAVAVLDGLGLLEGEALATEKAPCARWILQTLQQRGQGQVLNRSELIQDVMGVGYLKPDTLRLEPEWVIVVIAAMIQAGLVELSVPGRKFSASDLEALAKTPLNELVLFRHLEKPRDWDIPALRHLFSILGLREADAQDVTRGQEAPLRQFQERCVQLTTETIEMRQLLQNGLIFWGRPYLTDSARKQAEQNLQTLKTFLESLQAYTTSARLKNLRYSVDTIKEQMLLLKTLRELQGIWRFIQALTPQTAWMSQAEIMLPSDHEWQLRMNALRQELEPRLKSEQGHSPAFLREAEQALTKLQGDWIKAYLDLHTQARLGRSDMRELSQLRQDPRLKQLDQLSTVKLMPYQQLRDFRERLESLKACPDLLESELRATPRCPHCQFNPSQENLNHTASSRLQAMDQELDKILMNWQQTLVNNLEDPSTRQSVAFLSKPRQKLIQSFISSGSLPEKQSREFLEAVESALDGLYGVELSREDLIRALLEGGSPTTVDEFKNRFDQWLEDRSRGYDKQKIRLILE